MDSPCKGCKRRKVGCHDSEKCEKWREYVEANKERLLKNQERREAEYQTRKDRENHLRRHGRSHQKGQI